MEENISHLLRELRITLEKVYDDRLKGVYLFGSFARGDQDNESDIDILIILDHYTSYGNELDRTGELVSSLSLKYGVSISRVFTRQRDWHRGESPLLRSVKLEGIPA